MASEIMLDPNSNNLLSAAQTASEDYNIIKEYQALTKNSQKRGEEKSCKYQLDQILTERVKKSVTNSQADTSAIIAALWQKRRQLPNFTSSLSSTSNISLHGNFREYGSSHQVNIHNGSKNKTSPNSIQNMAMSP